MTFRLVASVAAMLAAVYACGETLPQSDDDAPGDGGGGSEGAANADGAGGDAEPGPAACDRQKPFGPASDVKVSGDYSIEAARFNDGRTAAYMALCPADGNKVACDLFLSPYENGAFAAHNPMTAVSSPFYDSYPTVTANGELLVFGSTRAGGVKIFVATAVNASFATATARQQMFNPPVTDTNEPYVLGSGTALWFGGSSSSAKWEIYRTTTWTIDAAAPIERVEELCTDFDDQAPVVAEDEREVFFSSNRAQDANGLDIYRAAKAPGDAKFAAAEHLSAFSKDGNDWPVWISPDRCDLYFINKAPSGPATLRVASRR